MAARQDTPFCYDNSTSGRRFSEEQPKRFSPQQNRTHGTQYGPASFTKTRADGRNTHQRGGCRRSEQVVRHAKSVWFSRRACTPRKWDKVPIVHGVQARRLNTASPTIMLLCCVRNTNACRSDVWRAIALTIGGLATEVWGLVAPVASLELSAAPERWVRRHERLPIRL